MSLRQKLTKPLVVVPVEQHTHTVIFLHRFSADTTENELRRKLLSEKMTRNHKSLAEQFPSVRWVFPHPKDHPRHWSNLSPEDKTELGLTGCLPYITQVVQQEAHYVGGLDRVILGGQGETAEAAHEALSGFPELNAATIEQPGATAAFIQEHLHPTWTEVSQLKLAGFVGMHAQDGHATRDVRNYSIASKTGGRVTINNAIITNTPHRFINGGYKLQTTTWDGRRIDDFATFLASIGITRTADKTTADGPSKEILTPKQRAPPVRIDRAQDELDAKLKYAEDITRQKAADKKAKELILRRIEENKVERKIKQARAQEARLHHGKGEGAGFTGGVYSLKDVSLSSVPPAIKADDCDLKHDIDLWNGEVIEEEKID